MAQTIATTSRAAYQAKQILYIGLIIALFLTGLDKFTHFLTTCTRSPNSYRPDAIKAFVSSFDQSVAAVGEKRSRILTTAS